MKWCYNGVLAIADDSSAVDVGHDEMMDVGNLSVFADDKYVVVVTADGTVARDKTIYEREAIIGSVDCSFDADLRLVAFDDVFARYADRVVYDGQSVTLPRLYDG